MLKMLQQLKEWQQRVKSGGGSLADSPDVSSLQRTEREVSVRTIAVRSACPPGAVHTDISMPLGFACGILVFFIYLVVLGNSGWICEFR
jgi:hypothetical protein